VVQAYAVKHNPFAYFKNVQEGYSSEHSLNNVVGFDGPRGLYADLATGNVPSFSFIVSRINATINTAAGTVTPSALLTRVSHQAVRRWEPPRA